MLVFPLFLALAFEYCGVASSSVRISILRLHVVIVLFKIIWLVFCLTHPEQLFKKNQAKSHSGQNLCLDGKEFALKSGLILKLS